MSGDSQYYSLETFGYLSKKWTYPKGSDIFYIVVWPLRLRVSTLLRETGTKKAIHLTMIATYGIQPRGYSDDIQSQVTMNDLFVEWEPGTDRMGPLELTKNVRKSAKSIKKRHLACLRTKFGLQSLILKHEVFFT